jgi:hypothetical protein
MIIPPILLLLRVCLSELPESFLPQLLDLSKANSSCKPKAHKLTSFWLSGALWLSKNLKASSPKVTKSSKLFLGFCSVIHAYA